MLTYEYRSSGRAPDTGLFLQKASVLPSRFAEYAAAPRSPLAAWQRLCGLLLLFDMLAAQKIPMSDLTFTKEGKPGLSGDPVFFNLSHAGDLVAVALCDRPVGIDIEPYGQNPLRRSGIAARYFTPAERELLSSSAAPERTFTEIWVRKEAAVKESGAGLSALRQTDTVAVPPTLETVLRDGTGAEYFMAIYTKKA